MIRTFGIELECHLPTGKSRETLAAAIRAAGVTCYAEGYTHVTGANWKVVQDGSLGYDRREGAEVVSPVLCGEEGIAQARRVTAAMREFGCTISVKCGFHVHVGARDLSLQQLRALAVNFVHCETAFDAIVPPSRRRDLNQYILSNRTAFGGNYDNESVNRAIDAYLAADNTAELITVVSAVADKARASRYPEDLRRYRKLNLTAMQRHGTVEFRQHSGTVDPDKVENWVRLCVAFVERSCESKPRKRPSQKPHDPATEVTMLMKFLRAETSVRRFYQERRRLLAGANAPAE